MLEIEILEVYQDTSTSKLHNHEGHSHAKTEPNSYKNSRERIKDAVNAVQIPEFDPSGKIINPQQINEKQKEQFPRPCSQGYRTPYLLFGYEKTDGENTRSFDITLYSKLSLDGIHNKIFSKYEVHIMLTNSVRKMLQMKPVLFKDFEMLLLPSSKTYMYEN